MIERQKRRIGRIGIAVSLVLFGIKLWAAVLSDSAAVLSDALNAFLDVLAYSAVYVSIRVQDRGADENHPFGHRRAEPLGGLLIAIFASVLGATIIRDSLIELYQPGSVRTSPLSYWLIAISIALKAGMALWYFRGSKRSTSPALRASYVDSRNDVFSSVLALFGYVYGGAFDAAAASAIGAWIVYSGFRIGLENIGYLMGQAPPSDILDSIRDRAMSIGGIKGLNDLRAHYIGDRIHLELHVEVDRNTTLQRAHDIGVEVKRSLESLDLVQDAFIHIDPV